ncbi:MAG: hypothetical protein K9G38_07485 [Bacteroidales bacterium]|nr:hypothetical protein [Bacteroidales bacterium]
MNRRTTISFLLLLCFAVIPVHGMVPHQHHTGVILPVGDHSCPSDHHDHDHDSQEAPPQHCHAFNEVVFCKTSMPEVNSSPVAPVLFAGLAALTRNSILPGDPLINFIPEHITCFSHVSGSAFSLRGPPYVG